jgi:hypothetical protein
MAVGAIALGLAIAVGAIAVGVVVLPATGVPVAPVTGIAAVGAAAGAQAARARDKITNKVPIRVTRFNFCCFIINLLLLPSPIGEY